MVEQGHTSHVESIRRIRHLGLGDLCHHLSHALCKRQSNWITSHSLARVPIHFRQHQYLPRPLAQVGRGCRANLDRGWYVRPGIFIPPRDEAACEEVGLIAHHTETTNRMLLTILA